MAKIKKVISLLLTLALVLGTVTLPSPARAADNSEEFTEANYEIKDMGGASYKVYQFKDLVGTPAPQKQMKVGDLEISDPKPTEAVRGSDPALGDEVPYKVDVQWGTYDLQPGALGTPVYFQIVEPNNLKVIAQTKNVTGTGKYEFYKLPAWDDPDVNHDPSQWECWAPLAVEIDIRLQTGYDGSFDATNVTAKISQRGMPIYRAEYYTNSVIPTIEAQRTNKANRTNPVPINDKNLGENQYYSWAEAIGAGDSKPFFEGKELDIQQYGQDTLDSLRVSDAGGAARVKMAMKAPGKTDFDRGPGTFKDNGVPYHYEVTGDYLHIHIFTIRQDLTVKFDPNGGAWKQGKEPADQTIGHSMKLADTWAGLGPITVPDGANDLTPPAVAAGQPEKRFIGWNTDKDADVALFTDVAGYMEEVKDDTTFYAIYQDKAQGKIKYAYVDAADAAIDAKYHLDGVTYPAEKSGNKDETIANADLDMAKAPKFLGYKVTGVKTDPVPAQGDTAKYTEDGKYTVIFKYEKLADIIPAKTDDGQDNPDATEDVKTTYKTVTIKVDDQKGKFQKGGKDVTGKEFVYYVNPVEGKTLDNVLTESGLQAVSKDENANKIDAQKSWVFTPDKTKANADVAVATAVTKDNFEAGVTMEVNFGQTKAAQFKDKLKAVDIKVWKGDGIDWKKGVALKADDAALKAILDETDTKVTDLGEGGTIAAPKAARTSTEANLPNGATGNLKVSFSDGSELVVENQMLYVAPEKTKIVNKGEQGYVDPDKFPADKVKVDLKLGEGVQVGAVKGDAQTPVVYAGFYLKPNTGLAAGDFPAVEAQEGYKPNSVQWDPSELTKTWDADGAYVAKAEKQTIAEKVGVDSLAGVDFAIWKGDVIDWKKGVKVADSVTEQDLKDAIQGYLNDAKTKVTDATTPARSSDKVGKQKGDLTVTFSDNSTITVKDQTLYVWEHKTENNDNNKNDPKPEGAIQVSFAKGTGVTALDPANKTMTVKSGTALVDADFPKATVDEANGYVTPAVWTGNGKTEGMTVSKTNSIFTATANKGKSDETVIPYEPKDPDNPADKNDPNIPTEDDNHKTIERDQYVVVGFNVAPAGAGTLTMGKIADKPVVSALVKKDMEWSQVTLPTTKALAPYAFWYWTDKTGKVADGDVRTARFIKSGDEIKPGDKPLPKDFFKVTVGKGDGVKADPLFGKSYAVKTGDKLEGAKFPALKAENNYKDAKWYNGENAVDNNRPEEVVITGETTFTAKASEVKFEKDKLTKIEFIKNPNKMTYTEGSATDGKMKLAGLQIKLTDVNNLTKTIGAGELEQYNVKVTPAEGTDLTVASDNGKPLTASTNVTENGVAKEVSVHSPGKLKVTLPASAKPTIKQPTVGDKTITGTGVPGAAIVVTDKDGQPIGEPTIVGQDNNWVVNVPDDKTLNKGDKITATQTEGGKTPASAETTVKGKTTAGGGSGFVPSDEPKKPDTGELNKEDHYQYLIGYPDGTFAPNKGMTRAEVATMFTRLLKDRPVKGQTYDAGFNDIDSNAWYANTVGYAVKKGIVSGYPDGSFKPNQAITRAEFSSIVARFAALTQEKDLTFTDIDASHWGYKAVRLAASNGWVSGYPDNTFRPENNITRAEVTSVTNRVLNRFADVEWIKANDAKVLHFSDVAVNDWFFEPVMEATMGHDFTRDKDGKTEHWTGLNGKSFI